MTYPPHVALSGFLKTRLRLPILTVLAWVQGMVLLQSSVAAECHSLLVSIPEQMLYAFDTDGFKIASYPVSTSKFGVGDKPGSYCTPLGMLAIGQKYGSGAKPGSVFKQCQRTGEIVKPNTPGRDPIVTRILTLRGLESENAHAAARGIFIHGSPEELKIGVPASYGCVRMKSADVVALYEMVRPGNRIEITDRRIGRFFDRFSRLIAPGKRLMPPVGRLIDKTANRVNRIVDPVDRLLPVAKLLDATDRAILVPVEMLGSFAKSKLCGQMKPGTEDKANAVAAALAADLSSPKRQYAVSSSKTKRVTVAEAVVKPLKPQALPKPDRRESRTLRLQAR